MSVARALLLALALAAGAALLAGGTAPFGRVLMAAGLPGLAAPLMSDPAWRGVALSRAGDHAGAAAAFAAADAPYNEGIALTRAGRYGAALEAFDIARAGGDGQAAANFDLLAAYYAGLALEPGTAVEWFTERDSTDPAEESFEARGNARAAGTGTEVTNVGALVGLPELESHGIRQTRKIFDDKFVTANRRWLETLPDVPGEFLAARIRHEWRRRVAEGTVQPEPEDPR